MKRIKELGALTVIGMTMGAAVALVHWILLLAPWLEPGSPASAALGCIMSLWNC